MRLHDDDPKKDISDRIDSYLFRQRVKLVINQIKRKNHQPQHEEEGRVHRKKITRSDSITFRVTPELKAKIEEYAAQERRSVSQYIEVLIEDHFKNK